MNMNAIPEICDTICTNIAKVMDGCATCINATNTNWADVRMARIICCSVVMIVLIIAVALIIGQIIKNNASRRLEEAKMVENEKNQYSELYRSLYKKYYEHYLTKVPYIHKSPSEIAKELLDEIGMLAKEKEGLSKTDYMDGLSKLQSAIKDLIEKDVVDEKANKE